MSGVSDVVGSPMWHSSEEARDKVAWWCFSKAAGPASTSRQAGVDINAQHAITIEWKAWRIGARCMIGLPACKLCHLCHSPTAVRNGAFGATLAKTLKSAQTIPPRRNLAAGLLSCDKLRWQCFSLDGTVVVACSSPGRSHLKASACA